MSKNKKIRWLSRSADLLPNYALCLDEKDFEVTMKKLGVGSVPMLASPQANATAHCFVSGGGKECVIVALGPEHTKYSIPQIFGLLTHEAVHVWQFYCDSIGERYPGKEQEAYSIQHISQNLWDAYVEMTGRKKL